MNNFILLNNPKNIKFHQSLIDQNENDSAVPFNPKFVLLFILILILFANLDNLKIIMTDNEPNYIMGGYSLYNLTYYPQISLIIYNFENWGLNDEQQSNFINNLKNQKLKDIQIIFLLNNKSEHESTNLIRKQSLIDNRISFYEYEKFVKNNVFELMNKITGKFTMVIDKLISFGENLLEHYFNSTKGKIKNIFQFKFENETLYLIKTKILSDLLDNGKFNFNYTRLIKRIKSAPLPNLNYISIAYCPNNIYTPFTYVSMLSALSSKSESTYISFYIITSINFSNSNADFIMSLYEQFDKFNITFLKIDDRYNNVFISRRMTKETYFRFSLGELLPSLNRIIYLDSDVIVYKDLFNLYNSKFNGKFVLGQITGNNRYKETGVYRINNGILCFDLYNMRKYKIEKKALETIKKGKNLYYHDQTLMNNFFKDYIGIFPYEYHTRNFKNFNNIKQFNNVSGNIYDNDYMYFSTKYPFIRHFLGNSKPFQSDKGHIEDWWYFARKSKFYVRKTRDLNKVFNLRFE